MKICIYGAGAIGGYLGVQLARAGADVSLVARGAHLAAMKSEGLKVNGPRGDVHLKPTRATQSPRFSNRNPRFSLADSAAPERAPRALIAAAIGALFAYALVLALISLSVGDAIRLPADLQWTLILITLAYLLSIPFAMRLMRRLRRAADRANVAPEPEPVPEGHP